MNQRYHQGYAAYWSTWDRGIKIGVGVLAAASAILIFPPEGFLWLSVLLAILSAMLAVVLNVFPCSEWAGSYQDLYRRWTELREEADSLQFVDGPSLEWAETRLRELESKYHRICATESAPNDAYLRKCYKDEKTSRGCHEHQSFGQEPGPRAAIGAANNPDTGENAVH